MTTTSTTTSSSSFSAPDISCGGCANAIRRSLGAVPGIKDINVDVESKTVTVTQDGPEDPQTILATLDRAGFPATQIETSSAAVQTGEASCSCCKG